jgi:hypothetical protein
MPRAFGFRTRTRHGRLRLVVTKFCGWHPFVRPWRPLLFAFLHGVCYHYITGILPLTIFLFPGFHVSTRRNSLAQFNMPAMSPTMTEGGIALWKKKEGEAFSTGDVLLEIVSIPYFYYHLL